MSVQRQYCSEELISSKIVEKYLLAGATLLESDLARDDAPMGVFITLRDPTPEMKRETALAGDYAY
jgi:hypothetical protein